jgi:ABC-type Fe3+-siderophore transport system permease subunit
MEYNVKHLNFIFPIFIIVMMLVSSYGICISDADSSSNDQLLLDMGNGDTTWIDIIKGDTYADTIEATLLNSGHTCTISESIITIDNKTSYIVGSNVSSGGTFTSSGTTGITVTSTWIPYFWNSETSEWEVISNLDSEYISDYLAIGFYPEGYLPAENPNNPSSWTCIAGDAENSGTQEADLSSETGSIAWTHTGVDGTTGVYSSVLVAGGFAFVKYGYAASSNVVVVCYDLDSGDEIWEFWYKCTYYETTTNLIVGDAIYVQSSNGQIYKFNWEEGPGENNSNVKTFNEESWGSTTAIPDDTGATLIGASYGDGPGSMVCDSGAIYLASSNGMIYCFDLNLNLIWSYQTTGHGYFTAPTVYDDYVSIGMYDGHLYILHKSDGTLIIDEEVYTVTYHEKIYGQVSAPCFVKDGEGYVIFVSYSDGKGISSQNFGIAVYTFDGENLEQIALYTNLFGSGTSTYLSPYSDSNFNGIYFMAGNGLYRMNLQGTYELLNSTFSELKKTKSSLVIVNNEYIFISCYNASNGLYELDMDGKIIGTFQSSFTSYSMCPVTVVDGMFLSGTDNGMFAITGSFNKYIPPSNDEKMELWEIIALILAILLITLILIWAVLKFVMKWEKPYSRIKERILHFFFGEDYTHNTRSKHKLWIILLIGLTLTFLAAIASLCIGSDTTLSLGEMFSALISSIQKGGHNLTYDEMLIYNSRLPRVLAAIGVGIGLSIAGAMYQAVIRNPLVDPYIMGVSAGAGTAAIAVIAFDFTFFGLLSSQDIYLTAFAAIIGGLIAFAFTMILAEKAGGTSINYVLSGIIIGLLFSAIQILLMVFAGNHISSALTWLYGSFASITWDQVWLILVPALTISIIPLIWAKEFNLVLLGEDQAKQMGLNVKRFNRLMLIAASVLTSFCVAFVGIIGFVGLVIPHLCRMLLGGDHRLVLPASIAFGGALLIFADLLSRVLLTGYELPVGAITTIIGVPVFAYLLIKKGKMYEG